MAPAFTVGSDLGVVLTRIALRRPGSRNRPSVRALQPAFGSLDLLAITLITPETEQLLGCARGDLHVPVYRH